MGCGSHDLWDDNLWWGCNHCGWAAGPDGPTMIFAKNLPGLAHDLKDIPTPSQFIRIVPNGTQPKDDDDDEL